MRKPWWGLLGYAPRDACMRARATFHHEGKLLAPNPFDDPSNIKTLLALRASDSSAACVGIMRGMRQITFSFRHDTTLSRLREKNALNESCCGVAESLAENRRSC
jgi:hypothetical protein